jgi:hypothetical protein
MIRRVLVVGGVVVTLAVAGCGNPGELYPLKVGSEWTFTVIDQFAQRVQKVKVTRRVPVALTNGYELDGPMGISRLAWKGSTLYAEEFPNTRVYKPMPILVAGDPKANLSWSGTVQFMGQTVPAQATLHQEPESIDIGTKKFDTVHATLIVKIPGKSIEVQTWYAMGIGPIRQDQRTNGKLDAHLELLGAP